MRAGVDDGLRIVAMREMRAVRLREGELQDLHPRHTDGAPQLMHFRRDVPEILCDEREIAERIAYRVEKRAAGAGHPAAVNRSRLAGRDFPVRGESAEMIDAHDVRETQRGAEARDPPAELRLPQDIPAIQWIAPA